MGSLPVRDIQLLTQTETTEAQQRQREREECRRQLMEDAERLMEEGERLQAQFDGVGNGMPMPEEEEDEEEDVEEEILEESVRQEIAVAGSHGMVPATIKSILSLERVGVDDAEEDYSCAICLEELASGSKVCRMPCSHGFHDGCIVRWLMTRHCCPMCRYELPTY
ncbi:putative RING-H2 finger protein ATL21C [Tripterygium wilfordii]|uniref:RING-type E3 ubiquitin transferase n=1 Tax=Tripterygium wilfordii TaxID=458696 RepID=A0A7J7CB61_TRIWF|nr:E3 ubiquitin-protein ligase RDUF2-like [Tripterygium wilfordii]KAF5731411.1 putative RING-H2 finger protein ATL21C [Tripterygium wilfordii]